TMWARRSSDPAIGQLVDRMCRASDLFRSRWPLPLPEVVALEPVRKTVTDPELGLLAVEQTAWQLGDKSDHVLILSVPLDEAGNNTSEKLPLLLRRREERR